MSDTSRETKRQEGIERNAAWAKLTNAQKLVCLDNRLGVGQGAKRQREKLAPKVGK